MYLQSTEVRLPSWKFRVVRIISTRPQSGCCSGAYRGHARRWIEMACRNDPPSRVRASAAGQQPRSQQFRSVRGDGQGQRYARTSSTFITVMVLSLPMTTVASARSGPSGGVFDGDE